MAFIQKIKGKKGPIYKVHYKEPATGRRRCKNFNRRKDAEAFRDGPKAGRVAAKSRRTVRDITARWLHVCEHVGRKGREPIALATLRSYTRQAEIIRACILQHDGAELVLGECLVSELDASHCEAFRDYLVKAYKRPYARKILVTFKAILEQAKADGHIDHRPADNVYIRAAKRDPVAAQTATDKAPSLGEIRTILDTLQSRLMVTNTRHRRERERYKLIIETMIFGGTRPGEALGLPWSKVDFERGGIHIVQDVECDGTIGLPKSASAFRFIPMPDCYMRQLRDWQKLCPASDYDLVFPNWQGNPESVSNLNHRGWRPLLRAAGITTDDGKPKYPPKSLRHARASLEIESGANPKEIQELMGHASIRITYDVYGHLFDAHAERRATRANAIAHMLTQPVTKERVTDL